MNTSEAGHIAEKFFEIECLKKGWDVCQPVVPRAYDYLICKQGGTWKKVQIKKAYIEQSASGMDYARITTVRTGVNHWKRPYAEGDWDYIAMVILEEDAVYLIPWNLLEGRSKITKPLKRRTKVKMGRPPAFDWDNLEMTSSVG